MCVRVRDREGEGREGEGREGKGREGEGREKKGGLARGSRAANIPPVTGGICHNSISITVTQGRASEGK
jgi:hypothetical protein